MAFIRNPDDQESVTPVLGGQSSVVDTTQPAQVFSKVNNYLKQGQSTQPTSQVNDVDLSGLPKYKALEVSRYNAPANYTAPVSPIKKSPITQPFNNPDGSYLDGNKVYGRDGKLIAEAGIDPIQPTTVNRDVSRAVESNTPYAPYFTSQTSPYANIMNDWEKALQTQINTPPNAQHFAASDQIKDLNDQLYGLGKYANTGAVTQGQQEYWNQKNAAAPWNVQVPGYVPAAPLQKTPEEQARDDMFLQSVRTESDRLNAQRQAAIDYTNTHQQEVADRNAMFLQSVRDSSDRDNAIRQLAIDRYNQANPNSKI